MVTLLTQQDLAKRWQVAVKSIENCRKDGIITAVKGVPGIRFTLEQIENIEVLKLERFSPLERKKLEMENEELRITNEKLKKIIGNILSESAKLIALVPTY